MTISSRCGVRLRGRTLSPHPTGLAEGFMIEELLDAVNGLPGFGRADSHGNSTVNIAAAKSDEEIP